jgi:lipid-binding SYLF domain-containing protein
MQKNMIRALLVVLLLLTHQFSLASDKEKAEGFVSGGLETLNNFANDPEMTWFRKNVKRAKGVLVVPQLLKAGFIFGGSGGTGVLLRHRATRGWGEPAINTWSYPAFYTMGSVSWGLQIGAEAAEVVLLVMTDKGMDTMLSTKIQLGADVSVAAGPVGAGAKAATADVLQFSRTKGAFGGMTLEGSVISPRNSLNEVYYGQAYSPLDILVQGEARNPQAYDLRARLLKLSE